METQTFLFCFSTKAQQALAKHGDRMQWNIFHIIGLACTITSKFTLFQTEGEPGCFDFLASDDLKNTRKRAYQVDF
jgi:hypothetical protein